MDRPVVRVDDSHIARATARAVRERADILKLACNLTEDPQAQERKAAQRCPLCFYSAHRQIVQHAFTSRPCGYCNELQVYANTDTDVLCSPCAEQLGLCKRCGADRALQPRD